MERTDKMISKALCISRTDAKLLIKQGAVTVNGKTVKNPSDKCDEKSDDIAYLGKSIKYSEFVYIMMNKPKGVISASQGGSEKTVVDILPQEMKRKGLFPAGRLDKDTTGFVLITDDGAFAHSILSPKNHIPKTYIAVVDKPVTREIADTFLHGVELKNGVCMPAVLEVISSDATVVRVEIKQGMYHQIKRMFGKFGLNVVELRRVKIGGLALDESLEEGECRYISDEELAFLKKQI